MNQYPVTLLAGLLGLLISKAAVVAIAVGAGAVGAAVGAAAAARSAGRRKD
jgi:stage V sporulation protein SpoVS